MSDESANFTGVDHVGIIVSDAEECARILEGLGMPLASEIEVPGRVHARFFSASSIQLEVLDLIDPEERAQRLGDHEAVIEHVAFASPDLARATSVISSLGIDLRPPGPAPTSRDALSCWSVPSSSAGVLLQFVQLRPSA